MTKSIRFFALVTMTLFATASITQACEILDRACWEAQRAGAMGGNGQPALYQRNASCHDMLMNVHSASQNAIEHLYTRSRVFSPTGHGLTYDNPTGGVGYIDHADVHAIERELMMIENVAIRDTRMVRYDGADQASCEQITDDAIARINQIKDALP